MSTTQPSAPVRPGESLPDRLIGADLRGANLMGQDLSGRDLSGADLTGARLTGVNLQNAVLHEANLEGAQLLGADLSCADLSSARLASAQMGGAQLGGANLFGADATDATLSKVDAQGADLRRAVFHGARVREADLRSADLGGASFYRADLTASRVAHASFHDVDLREAVLRDIDGYPDADWVGCNIGHVDFTGAYLLRREIVDQNYLHEFRNQSRGHALVYILWSASSNCGRSFARWALLNLFVAGVFSILYAVGDIDFGGHQTLLSPLYFSVVTITTLGYGDVIPASGWAQVMVISEVIVGYVMLGGLMSIFANKMGRRGD
ncbi:MAG: hypothetical protein GY929_13380 [Actinomycetia bacterium]|nr:hypothetical protein [Actinomycetes bacterium]